MRLECSVYSSRQRTVHVKSMKSIDYNTDLICNSPNLDNTTNEFDDTSASQTCIDLDNLIRCWYTYIPESAKNTTDPVPLVVDLHASYDCAYMHAMYSGWAGIAEKQGFIVVWPQANIDESLTDEPCWDAGDCCCEYYKMDDPIDDTQFLRHAVSNTVDSVSDEVNVDTKRIYFTGYSNGCAMSQTMAARASDLVAAVCCVAGFSAASVSSYYQATAIQNVHGDKDDVIPYNDGSWWDYMMDGIEDAETSFDYWGDVNGCTQKVTNSDASNLYATHSYLDCTDNATVQLVQVFNEGHTQNMTSVDTAQLSWDFCSQYEIEFAPNLTEPVPYVDPYFLPAPASDGSYLCVNVIPYVFLLVYFTFKL